MEVPTLVQRGARSSRNAIVAPTQIGACGVDDDIDDLWDDGADAGLVADYAPQVRTAKRRPNFGQERVVCFQVCACCILVIGVIAACLAPLMVHTLDPALKDAVKSGDVEAIAQRLDASDNGKQVNAQGAGELTALHWAAIAGQAQVAAFLLDRRADVNLTSSDDMSPLHYAAREGSLSVVTLLLAHSANLDGLDVNGWTPLHWAAVYNQPGVVSELLRARADPLVESVDTFHRTPLELAKANRHFNLEDVLAQAEAEARASAEADSPDRGASGA